MPDCVHMDLSEQSFPRFKDYNLAIYFALAFPVARFFLDACVYQTLAKWMINSNAVQGGTKSSKDIKSAKITKSTESMWKLTWYSVAEMFIYFISFDEPWFGDIHALFDGWPYQIIKLPLKLYYTSQFGFYIYSIVALLVWETRRKDFNVMMCHHLVTLVLVGYSYITRFFRIGCMVLALHDASDLILELAKLFKYSGRELGASICFGVFVLSWLLLRLVYFPFWIIRASSCRFVKHLNRTNIYNTWLYYIFNTMLITLLVLHIYWWMMICFMIQRLYKNGGAVGEDIRSDSEEED